LRGLSAWLVTRHEDVRRLFIDPRLSADPRHHDGYKPPTAPGAARWLNEMPFRATPAGPDSLGRRMVASAMTPRAAARIETQIRGVVDELAEPLRGRTDTVD